MSKYKTIFDNDEVVVDVDDEGNYRVSFFEDYHWKDEYFYTKWKNTEEYKEQHAKVEARKREDDAEVIIDKILEEDSKEDQYEDILDKMLREYKLSNPYPTYYPYIQSTPYVPECCRGCSNHPSNGGSGICHCTAPLFDSGNPYRITC